MSFRNYAVLLILPLVLVACADTTATQPVPVTENPISATTYPGPINSTLPAYPNPEPAMDTSAPVNPAYPEPGNTGTNSTVIPPSGYEPQPGDENLKRGPVFLDIANTQFSISQFSSPVPPTIQAEVVLHGNLPNPCHSLRVVVAPVDENRVINLEVYSVVKPDEACITVLEPFTASIPLGSYSDDQYTMMVNGEWIGEFSGSSGVAPAVPVTPL